MMTSQNPNQAIARPKHTYRSRSVIHAPFPQIAWHFPLQARILLFSIPECRA